MKPLSRKRRKHSARRKKSFKGGHWFEEKICLDENGSAGDVSKKKYRTRRYRQMNPFYKRNEKCYTQESLEAKTEKCRQLGMNKNAHAPAECDRLIKYDKSQHELQFAPFVSHHKSLTTTNV